MIIYLASNEFTVRDDLIGFLDDGGEVLEYLSIDTFIEQNEFLTVEKDDKVALYYNSSVALPRINFHLELSD